MTAWYTRPGKVIDLVGEQVSPSLLYHKWHAYDLEEGTFKTEKTRVQFLDDVAKTAEAARRHHYANWYARYVEALDALGVPRGSWLHGNLAWRLVVGFATNPALESGLTLHPLLGFPYLPGSAVRGLVHHVAEMELLDTLDLAANEEVPDPPDAAVLDRFLSAAESIWALFGSLCVEPIDRETWRRLGEEEATRPQTPRSYLERWLAGRLSRDQSRREAAARARRLLDRHTGGMVAFYDAVPAPDAADLLEPDILNPHYPRYYDSKGESAPPSDDQDPRPVYFLAVRGGVSFGFPVRLAAWPAGGREARDEAEKDRRSTLHGLTRDEAAALIRGWLERGLSTWGAGGKTAAGYGYFDVSAKEARSATNGPGGAGSGSKREPKPREARQAAVPPVAPDWQARVRAIRWGEAQADVPRLLADLKGDDRKRAALEVVKNLGRKKLLQRQDPWAHDLLVAAGVD
jgi:CRISPR type III-B/RAMP module RAMP protein Cmr6